MLVSNSITGLLRHGRLVAKSSLRPAGRRLCANSASDSSKVYLKRDAYGGLGAFASAPIKKGDLVERGVVRVLPVDGNVCPFVFTWSEDRSKWASGSGCSVFYNAALDGTENTEMKRYFDEDRFEIFALRDIAEHEEVTHLYKSIEWRECFKDLKVLRDRISSGSTTPMQQKITPAPKGALMDSSKVYTKHDAFGGLGAFAAVPIKKGELVERGMVRRLPVDGNECPFVFTWSEDRTTWASGSGASVFYNASLDGNENTEMKRFYDEDRFEIYALRDIAQHEELTHLYKSIEWRDCFQDLKAIRSEMSKTSGLTKDRKGALRDRALMTDYWETDHAAPTLENMMLDSKAAHMDVLERPEIMSELPSLSGKKVVELGAGIGRFSGILASKAEHVVAVDFVESSCAENRRANAERKNLEVIKADVTQLELEADSFDLVFSNWLLMYLTDSEVRDFAQKTLQWLKPGGFLFFRESCFHASGNAQRRFNPTKYRDPETYSQMFSDCVTEDGSRFQLVATNCVETYANMKDNVNQMWFRWVKVGAHHSARRMRLLETGQYSTHATLRYEKIFGRNYINTGGDAISQRLLEACEPWLKPGARILDVGSGLGGTALYFAEKCPQVYVHGISTSGENLALLTGRHVQRPNNLRRRITWDLAHEYGVPENELKYPPNSFDVVIMREVLMYLPLEDKAVLLRKAARLLRPGGKLVVIDYCSGTSTAGSDKLTLAERFQTYLKRHAYFLMRPTEQEALLSHHFSVKCQDCTEEFVGFMEDGLSRIESHFGPTAPERCPPLASDEVAEMSASLEAWLKKSLPGNFDVAAEEATEAALEKINMHVEAKEAEADRCKRDYEWSKDIWELKKRAALAGELRWCLFLANREDFENIDNEPVDEHSE